VSDIAIEPGAHGVALSGAPLPLFDVPVSQPWGRSPLRRPGSVRRTMTLDATWPDGQDGDVIFAGDARDIVTEWQGGGPVPKPAIVATAHIDVVAEHRVMLSVTSTPPRPELAQLSGARAGGYLRAEIDKALPGEKRGGTPLYLLLDDLAGASLVGGWAWSRWTQDWMSRLSVQERADHAARMEGICIGFRPGSDALSIGGRPVPDQNASRVPSLVNPEDPDGWHPLIDRGGVNFRRARRIDVWREGDVIHVESGFQDSASAPDGGDRIAIHEYRLTATADAATQCLRSVVARPGTLPYKECRAAPVNVDALVGVPLVDLRNEVLLTLRKTAGCTHLNDMLRALAEVPALASHLPDPVEG
jgi:hypothetical protein